MLADVLSPIYFSPPGLLVCSLLSLAGIVLIEGTVLRLLRWGSWKITFLHAFIINLISSLLGTGLLIFTSQRQFDYAFPPSGSAPETDPSLISGPFRLSSHLNEYKIFILLPSSRSPRTCARRFGWS